MRYIGSKRRLFSNFKGIIQEEVDQGKAYYEPFAGGMNAIDQIKGERFANDINEYIIQLIKELIAETFTIPTYIDRQVYKEVKKNRNKYDKAYVGYVGIICSFRGIFFDSFADDNVKGKNGKIRDYQQEGKRNLLKQLDNLKDINFTSMDYKDVLFKPNSVIYCDPPYKKTYSYNQNFNHDEFYEWCRDKKKEGHIVFISEYNMPEDFKCVWEKEIVSNIATFKTNTRIEKLFTL